MHQRVRVRVPATTANLGSGFDVVGLALDLFNEVEVAIADSDRIEVSGCDAASIPCDDSNYVIEAARRIYALAGVTMPALAVRIDQQVPVGSGLGSSAAGLVAGAVAANALLGDALDALSIVRALAEIEGHAEQVAAGVLGGAVATVPSIDVVTVVALEVHPSLCFALATPSTRLSTKDARRVLPASLPFCDAVAQAAAAIALAPGLARADRTLLEAGTRDRLHQEARAALLPSAPGVLAAAVDAGALASCWSGAGPTMLAICDDATVAEKVTAAMRDAFEAHGTPSDGRVCHLDVHGATVLARD